MPGTWQVTKFQSVPGHIFPVCQEPTGDHKATLYFVERSFCGPKPKEPNPHVGHTMLGGDSVVITGMRIRDPQRSSLGTRNILTLRPWALGLVWCSETE